MLNKFINKKYPRLMQALLFQTHDYRKFLQNALVERGKKKGLCEFIPCQSTFLSNVMSGGGE